MKWTKSGEWKMSANEGPFYRLAQASDHHPRVLIYGTWSKAGNNHDGWRKRKDYVLSVDGVAHDIGDLKRLKLKGEKLAQTPRSARVLNGNYCHVCGGDGWTNSHSDENGGNPTCTTCNGKKRAAMQDDLDMSLFPKHDPEVGIIDPESGRKPEKRPYAIELSELSVAKGGGIRGLVDAIYEALLMSGCKIQPGTYSATITRGQREDQKES